MKGRRPKIGRAEWQKVDWSRPRSEIARALGVSASTVCRWADRVGATPARSARASVDWENVDWENKTTAELKRETGKTRQQISKMRKKHAPQTVKQLV